MEKKRFLHITLPEDNKRGGYIEDIEGAKDALDMLLMDGEIGDGYVFTIIEMTQEEYENLPEFEGF